MANTPAIPSPFPWTGPVLEIPSLYPQAENTLEIPQVYYPQPSQAISAPIYGAPMMLPAAEFSLVGFAAEAIPILMGLFPFLLSFFSHNASTTPGAGGSRPTKPAAGPPPQPTQSGPGGSTVNPTPGAPPISTCQGAGCVPGSVAPQPSAIAPPACKTCVGAKLPVPQPGSVPPAPVPFPVPVYQRPTVQPPSPAPLLLNQPLTFVRLGTSYA